jgi:hypothetical protein
VSYWLVVSPFISAGLIALYVQVFQPWTKAYAETAAALKARDERLDKIIKEVDAVTRTQERIKSELSGDLWHRPTHWNQKREIYANLIRAAQDLAYHHHVVSSVLKLIDEARDADDKNQFKEKLNETLGKINQAHGALSTAGALAEIVASDECNKYLTAHAALLEGPTEPIEKQWADKEATKTSGLRMSLIKAARNDLLAKS